MNATRSASVCVVGGAGHVGLPLALAYTERGHRVVLQDIDAAALSAIQAGKLPFSEKGAQAALDRALSRDLLAFETSPEAVAMAESVIVTIGTPVDEFLSPEVHVFRQLAETLLPALKTGQLVVLRSTVFPGTTEWLHRFFERRGKHIELAYCPERIVQGFALTELGEIPQLVSGMTPTAVEAATELFVQVAPECVVLTPLEAELSKLFTNSYRYIQFAAANQFYMIADSAGVDYNRILTAMKKHYPRASDIPGAGFAAGPCLLKDTMQLAAYAQNQFSLGTAAMLVNEGFALHVVDRMRSAYPLSDMTVGILGMAFKAESDDTRSSLSYKVKKALGLYARDVLCTDPLVTSDDSLLPVEAVLERSDLLVLCAPHAAYGDLDLGETPVVDVWGFLKSREGTIAG